jgi:hypothetical protein
MLIGDLKQEIARINNRVNQTMYGPGLRWQRVDLVSDKVVAIVSENMRLKPLSALDPHDRVTTRMVDVALLEEFKGRLKLELEEALGLGIQTILKDYDPQQQLAGTLIIFKDPLPTT